jgi:Na+-driven multidrug efflux pump
LFKLNAPFHTDRVPVYGPKSLNLGFIGAPLSMTISYISVAVLTVFFVMVSNIPRQAGTDTDPDTTFARDMKHLFLEGLAGMGAIHPVTLISSWSQ